MTQSPLYKRAFVRGLNTQLMQAGTIGYATKEAADYAADFVADHVAMPDPYFEGKSLTMKVASDLCIALVRASEFINSKTGGASAALSKQASAIDPHAQASVDAKAILEKIAMEDYDQGGMGGGSGAGASGTNTLSAAAEHSTQAELDLRNRPEGYANTGVGNYIDKGKGSMGVEETAQRSDPAEGGTNSVIQNSKVGSEALRKAAASGGGRTGTAPNTLSNAAGHSTQAELDEKNRPAGYAVSGVGNTSVTATGSAVIGAESSKKPSAKPGATGTNSVNTPKTAAERHLERTAALIVPFLPSNLTDAQKVAHIRACDPLTVPQQISYVSKLASAYQVPADVIGQIPEAFSTHATKVAGVSGEDDYEVAQALEAAASSLSAQAEAHEDSAIKKLTAEKTAAALAKITGAASKVAG